MENQKKSIVRSFDQLEDLVDKEEIAAELDFQKKRRGIGEAIRIKTLEFELFELLEGLKKSDKTRSADKIIIEPRDFKPVFHLLRKIKTRAGHLSPSALTIKECDHILSNLIGFITSTPEAKKAALPFFKIIEQNVDQICAHMAYPIIQKYALFGLTPPKQVSLIYNQTVADLAYEMTPDHEAELVGFFQYLFPILEIQNGMIGGFECDMLVLDFDLNIEIDGSRHSGKKKQRDKVRDLFLGEEYGMDVIRVRANYFEELSAKHQLLDDVVSIIYSKCYSSFIKSGEHKDIIKHSLPEWLGKARTEYRLVIKDPKSASIHS